MVVLDQLMTIPGLNISMITLHHSDAALDEASRDQELFRLHRIAIHFSDMLGFFRDIEGIGGFKLHAVG